jgi:hypothetical protein
MFNWRDNTDNTNEELAAAAAKVMYGLGHSERDAPLRYVIERLVIPEDVSAYTEAEMKEWILDWLEERKTE